MHSTSYPNLVSYSLLLIVVVIAGSNCTLDLDTHACADDTDCPDGAYCDDGRFCVFEIPESSDSGDISSDPHQPRCETEAAYQLRLQPEPGMTVHEGTGRFDVPEDEEGNAAENELVDETDGPPLTDQNDEQAAPTQPDWGDTLDGEHCEVAIPLALGRNDIDTRPYTDDYSELDGACPGISSRGADMVGSITVPARTRLELSIDTADFDAMVAVSRTCSFTSLACVAGSFPGQSAPDFVNLTDDDVEVFVIIDARGGVAGTGVLVVALSGIGNPDGDSLYNAIDVDLDFYETVAYHGDARDYTNSYGDYSAIDGHLSCCHDCVAEGNDAVFRIAAPEVDFDYFVRAAVDGERDSTLALATSNSASPSTCELTDGDWVQHYQRESDPDVNSYWVIVDGAHDESEGLFDIGFSVF